MYAGETLRDVKEMADSLDERKKTKISRTLFVNPPPEEVEHPLFNGLVIIDEDEFDEEIRHLSSVISEVYEGQWVKITVRKATDHEIKRALNNPVIA